MRGNVSLVEWHTRLLTPLLFFRALTRFPKATIKCQVFYIYTCIQNLQNPKQDSKSETVRYVVSCPFLLSLIRRRPSYPYYCARKSWETKRVVTENRTSLLYATGTGPVSRNFSTRLSIHACVNSTSSHR